MNRATTIAATLAATLTAQGCATAPPTPEAVETARRVFIGDWAGINTLGWRMEARVESIGEDGTVTGTGCHRMAQGTIRGARLQHGNARLSQGDGRMIQVAFGPSRFTVSVLPSGSLAMIARRTSGEGKGKLRTHLDRTDTLQCADLFPPEPVELDTETAGRTTGVTGYWTTGVLANGNVLELAVLDVAPKGEEVRGVRCLAKYAGRKPTLIRINTIGPAPQAPLRGRWDDAGRTLTLASDARWGATGGERTAATLHDAPGAEDDRLDMRYTVYVGTRQETTETLTLKRGTNPLGCTKRIRTPTRQTSR